MSTLELTKDSTPVEVRAAWSAALRSGEYTQTRSTLRNEEGSMCCLGVLCDLAQKAGLGEWGGGESGYEPDSFTAGDNVNEVSIPPYPVTEWAGFTHQSPMVYERVDYTAPAGGKSFTSSVVVLNDHAEYSFEQIADLVDAGKIRVTA